MAERGRYLYAISRGLDPTVLTGEGAARGLHDAPLELVEHRGLSAVVSDVDLDEFGEEGLKRNLESLDWLEATARGHDDVVQALAVVGPVAPVRLATICLGDDGVRARLDEWYHALQQVLDRVSGRREWSVKAYAPEQPRAAQAGVTGGAEADRGGAAYLRRKRQQLDERQGAEAAAHELAERMHAELAATAVANRRLPAQDPRLTGHTGSMILNAAYLVDDDRGADFAERVHALAEQHPEAGVAVGGPWPAYSFAMLEQR